MELLLLLQFYLIVFGDSKIVLDLTALLSIEICIERSSQINIAQIKYAFLIYCLLYNNQIEYIQTQLIVHCRCYGDEK